MGRGNQRLQALLAAITALGIGACTTVYPVVNAPGTPTTYQDPGTRGPVSGIGIEANDIVGMTDRMMRDMLASPVLAGSATPPRVIIDAEYFANESSSRLNKNSITDRLRVALNRSSQGRMVFVGRQYADMVDKERQIKRQGVTDAGTTPLAKAQLGGDYRLGGRLTSLDARSPATGQMSRYNQIIFEMVDLETGQIVWSGLYEFLKTAQDDVIYR
jgi:PBP1b-binding outer membrane lipoprotein LpoB